MEIRRALVVYKRSFYEILKKSLPKANRKAILRAHQENQRCLEAVSDVLRDLRISHDVRHRSNIHNTTKADLVISVGGDGTFLSAASEVLDTPILGVNSSPRHSVGFFCGATIRSFKRVLTRALDGEAEITTVRRMRVTLDEHVLHDRILNDILITQAHPAATSRYIIRVGRRREDQRSSGIWVATPAGSTAAIRAAGGKLLPIGARRLQYRVREPYLPPAKSYDLLGGVLKERQKLSVESRMMKGRLYLDGPRNSHDFTLGSVAVFEMRGHPLKVVALDDEKRSHWA